MMLKEAGSMNADANHPAHASASWIEKTPGVCGGAACIRRTRIPVWSLVESRRLGINDETLRTNFEPPLSPADLVAAWNYFEQNSLEVEREIWQNQAVMVEPPAPTWFVVKGRRLGLTDEEIRDAFEPPLSAGELEDVWTEAAANAQEVDRLINHEVEP